MSVEGEILVRPAEERDLEEIVTVHAAAFPDPRGREARRKNFCENPRGKLSDLLVAERGGRIAGHGFLFPMGAWFGGRRIPVGGIASVAVAPDARRSRVGRALLLAMIDRMRSAGTPLSMLYPFRHEFYRNLGWGLIGEMRRYRFRPDALPLAPERARVREGRPERLDRMRACYEAFARSRTALVDRPEGVWAALLRAEPLRLAVVPARGDDDGEIEGYCLYRFAADHLLSKQEIEVFELVANGDEARFALWGFLSAQRDQVERIQISLPPDEPLHVLLREPRGVEKEPVRGLTFVSAHLAVGLMLRIVDVEGALLARGWPTDGEVVVDCPDRLCGHEKPVALSVRAGRPEVSASGRGPILRTDPPTLAQIYGGYVSATTAVSYRLATVEPASAVADVDRLFHLPPPATLDVF